MIAVVTVALLIALVVEVATYVRRRASGVTITRTAIDRDGNTITVTRPATEAEADDALRQLGIDRNA